MELTIFCLVAYTAFCAAVPMRMACTEEPQICVLGGNGSDVVNAVIAEIEEANIFNETDNRFLRRLAYVATRDGTIYTNLNEMNSYGGIWNFDEEKLRLIQQAKFLGSIGVKLTEVNKHIEQMYGIDILENFIKHRSTLKPLYCGLATRFYLYYLKLVECVCCMPSAINLRGQADLWITHFTPPIGRSSCLEDYFVEEVKQLEEQEGWSINADIIFVLDLSNSVEEDEFEKMKRFQLGFVERMTIGEKHNKVGTITFKENAVTEFNLNKYTNKDDLLEAINNTNHNGLGLTNIQDALCLLNRSFSEGNGGRPASDAVFRIAIIMTDGMSNQHHSPCNWSNIAEATNEVRGDLSPLEVYVIGVGESNDLNETELKTIASSGCYTHIDSFDLLEDVRGSYFVQMAHRASAKMKNNDIITAIMGYNEIYRYNLQTESSIMVNVCVAAGSHVKLFGSTFIPNPNGAFYEYYLDVNNENAVSDVCHSAVIDLKHGVGPPHQRSVSERKTVYFSVVGKAKTNTFTVTMNDTDITDGVDDFSNGDYTGEEEDDDAIMVAATSSALLLLISASILVTAICGCTLYHSRKKKKIEDEDEYRLLPQNPE